MTSDVPDLLIFFLLSYDEKPYPYEEQFNSSENVTTELDVKLFLRQ